MVGAAVVVVVCGAAVVAAGVDIGMLTGVAAACAGRMMALTAGFSHTAPVAETAGTDFSSRRRAIISLLVFRGFI